MARLNGQGHAQWNEGDSGLVTSSGTTVTAFSALNCGIVTLQADHSNTSLMMILIGSGSTEGIKLAPGEMRDFYVSNMQLLYYKAGTTGDKIRYFVHR